MQAIFLLNKGMSEHDVASAIGKSRSWVQLVKRHPDYERAKKENATVTTQAVVTAVAQEIKKTIGGAIDEWDARRKVQRQEEWEISQALMQKAREMLKCFSLEEKRWGMKDICACLETSSKIARLSSELWEGDLNAAISLVRRYGFEINSPEDDEYEEK